MIVSTAVVDDVRTDLLAQLASHDFGDVKVAENVPEPCPDYFVRLESGADTGIDDVIVDHTTLVIQVYGPVAGRDRAEKLSRYVAAIISDLEGRFAGETFVYEAAVSKPQTFPDSDTRRPRWVFTARISSRAISV